MPAASRPVVLGLLVAADVVVAPAGAGAARDSLRLHVLDCGTMRGIETEPFLPGPPTVALA